MDVVIKNIVDHLAPELNVKQAVGHESAAQLLITASDNPDRFTSEAALTAWCGVSTFPAPSGKTHRHRLNRGGDQQVNSALHVIPFGRLGTQEDVAKKLSEGHSKMEALRCVKRYFARKIFYTLKARNTATNQNQIAA